MSTIWYQDDFNDQGDMKEDENGNVKVRHHLVIQMHCIIKGNDMPTTTELFTSRASITCSVGGQWKQYNPAGTNEASAFFCMGDGCRPINHPLDYVQRTQTWEYYGPWIDPPAGWGLADT